MTPSETQPGALALLAEPAPESPALSAGGSPRDLPRLGPVFDRLKQSTFRRQRRLPQRELEHLRNRGMALVRGEAAELIATRLAPARPPEEGRQTPYRGHPVFVAQHATATCCRSCLQTWYGIRKGQPLTDREQEYVLRVLTTWLAGYLEDESNPYALGIRQRQKNAPGSLRPPSPTPSPTPLVIDGWLQLELF